MAGDVERIQRRDLLVAIALDQIAHHNRFNFEAVENPADIKDRVRTELYKGARMNPAPVIRGLSELYQRNVADGEVQRWEGLLKTSETLQHAIVLGIGAAEDDLNTLRDFVVVGRALSMDTEHPQLFAAAAQQVEVLAAQATVRPTATTAEPAKPAGTSVGGHIDNLIDKAKGAVGPTAGRVKDWASRKYDQILPPAATTTPPSPAAEPEPVSIRPVRTESPEPRQPAEQVRNEGDLDREVWEAYANAEAKKLGYDDYIDMAAKDPQKTADLLHDFMEHPEVIPTIEPRVVEPDTEAAETQEPSSAGQTEQEILREMIATYGGRDPTITHYQEMFANPQIPEQKKIADEWLGKLGVPGHPEPQPSQPRREEPTETKSEVEDIDRDQKRYIEDLIRDAGGLEEARRIMGNWPLRPWLDVDKINKWTNLRAYWWSIFNRVEGINWPLPTEFVPEPQPKEPEGDTENKQPEHPGMDSVRKKITAISDAELDRILNYFDDRANLNAQVIQAVRERAFRDKISEHEALRRILSELLPEEK
ncbi:hypothetical protein HYZ78_04340 [Candidatus Microgenomates bacterium]|nr:hypothetical protein [Candidatus Microgenomates bacterium]